jgi:hypothetical protein
LNMVFAIASKYLCLTKTSRRACEQDHRMYCTRAEALAVNESTLKQHPCLSQIQVMGLLAFYHLSEGQLAR